MWIPACFISRIAKCREEWISIVRAVGHGQRIAAFMQTPARQVFGTTGLKIRTQNRCSRIVFLTDIAVLSLDVIIVTLNSSSLIVTFQRPWLTLIFTWCLQAVSFSGAKESIFSIVTAQVEIMPGTRITYQQAS